MSENHLDILLISLALTISVVYVFILSTKFTHKYVLVVTTFVIELSIYIYILFNGIIDIDKGHWIFMLIFISIIQEWFQLYFNKKDLKLYRVISAFIIIITFSLVYVLLEYF